MSEAQDCEEPESSPAVAAPVDGPVIETNRLVLRRPAIDDAPALAALADNPRVARNLIGLPHPYRLEHALSWIAGSDGAREQKHLVCLKNLGGAPRPIGVATLDSGRDGAAPRLGCWLGETFWGHGYATEVCHALVDFAFVHMGSERLSFTCRVTDQAGRRIVEKCGFQLVAQELARLVRRGDLVPVDRFQIDRRTWSSLREWEPLRLHRDAGGDTALV